MPRIVPEAAPLDGQLASAACANWHRRDYQILGGHLAA
jgi:hypothetical protein